MASRGRGRGGWHGARANRGIDESSASDFGKRILRHAPSESDVSSLGDLSPATLEALNITKESKFMKRLFKEYLVIRNNPLPYISVAPLPHDFTTWHGNLKGPEGTPYEGGVFHFAIHFDENSYPRAPPTVTMKSRIEHPCVYNGAIGLDFLTYSEFSKKKKATQPPRNTQRYSMWSPAYSAMSILIQLQAFLFEGTAEIALQNLTDLSEYTERRRKWESGVQFSVEQSLRFSCSECKHRPRKMWPPISDSVEPSVISKNELYLEDAVCFYSLKSHEEAALGVGINVTKDLRTGHIQTVSCVPDIISLNAFKGSKVNESWGQRFYHWMPLYLQSSSPERSLYLAQRSLSSMYTGGPNDFKMTMVLDFFPRLLCNLAVSFASSAEGGDALRALHAYCYMHRLFLQFVSMDTTLITTAKDKVKEFIEDPSKRHMDHTPAIGHLVVLLSLSDHQWMDLAPSYLTEGFDRNARRIIKTHPELATSEPNPKIDETRISRSFSAYNLSGLRFLMTQLVFNRFFVCPEGTTFHDVINRYDDHSSLIPKDMEDTLLEEKTSIMAVNNFSSFYEYVGQPAPSDEELLGILREAVANSKRKRYHGDKGIEVLSPEEFEKQRLGAIRPLEEMLVVKDNKTGLHDDEDQWKAMCETRFGLTEIPSSYTCDISQPWKHLYLQHNLQELVSKLNDNPDFKLLYQTLELSKDTLTRFDLVTFNPDNIKSHYFFLSRIIEILPKLTHLTISKGEISLGEKGFKELVKGMTKSSGALQVLDMRHLGITEAHVSKLAESHLTSEQLSCLNLEGNSLGSNGTIKLAKLMLKHRSLPNLSELNLKACQITDVGMKSLAEGLLVKHNIKKLDLSKNTCGAAGLTEIIKSLAYNPSIEELVLTDVRLGGDLSHLSLALSKLFELTVTLEKMRLWNTNIAGALNMANLKQLAVNRTLTLLDMGKTNMSVMDGRPFGIVIASNKSALEELDFEEDRFDVLGCWKMNEQAKGQVSSVTKLNLSKNVSLFVKSGHLEVGMPAVMTKFFSTTFGKVTDLNVSHCNLTASAVEVFSKVLSKNTPLKILDMSFNNIGKHGARFLASGLSTNTHLEVLRLDKNNLGAAGAHYLASLLEKPACMLKKLHLFCNYVDVPGAVALGKALQTNKHLVYLDLGMNRVRKRGAAAIIEMLGVNKTLETLCLKFNFIPDSWAIKIVKQLVEAPYSKVSTLWLAGNSLQYDTLVTIVTMLKECARDVTFDLAARAEYRDPERMERTVYVSPLALNVTPEMVKKMFYSKKCGAIKSVKIEKHRKKKTSFAKAKYALVEFAHEDSVELAVDLVRRHEAHIGTGLQPTISRAGLSTTST